MRIIGFSLLASLLMLTALVRFQSQSEPKSEETAANSNGVHDFDFEIGQWHVHHRVKTAKGDWTEWCVTDTH